MGLSVLALALGAAGCGSDDSSGGCAEGSCGPGQLCVEGECVPDVEPNTVGQLGRWTALALRSDGRAIVASYDSERENLVVLTDELDGSDKIRVVDGIAVVDGQVQNTDSGSWATVTVDAQDRGHIAWFSRAQGALKYGEEDANGDWSVTVVDGDGPDVRGTHAAIATDDGVVHVAYRDETQKVLRYARRETDGSWTSRVIAGSNETTAANADTNYGEYAQIAVIGGRARIAFYDRGTGDLKMARRGDDGTWAVSVLDGHDEELDVDTGDVGRFASMRLDANRNVTIAYYDATRGALKYLRPGASTTGPLVVDAGVVENPESGALKDHLVGQHVALAHSNELGAVMIYLDADVPAVKLATVSGQNVTDVRVLTEFDAGIHFDLQTDPSGTVLGAYGAWLKDDVPRTKLERFVLSSDGGAP